MFKVIDAKRLGSQQVKGLVGTDDCRETAKNILNSTLFYELELWKGGLHSLNWMWVGRQGNGMEQEIQ